MTLAPAAVSRAGSVNHRYCVNYPAVKFINSQQAPPISFSSLPSEPSSYLQYSSLAESSMPGEHVSNDMQCIYEPIDIAKSKHAEQYMRINYVKKYPSIYKLFMICLRIPCICRA